MMGARHFAYQRLYGWAFEKPDPSLDAEPSQSTRDPIKAGQLLRPEELGDVPRPRKEGTQKCWRLFQHVRYRYGGPVRHGQPPRVLEDGIGGPGHEDEGVGEVPHVGFPAAAHSILLSAARRHQPYCRRTPYRAAGPTR